MSSMSFYFISICLFLLTVLVLPLLFLKILRHVKRAKIQLPPSPPKLPILGHIHQLGELPHQSLARLASKYGPVMLLNFGRIPVVIISSAEAAKEVTKIHDLDCCSRPALAGCRKLSYNLLDISFSPYGEHWREIRKLCVLELFSIKRVNSFRFIREEEVALMINSISESSSLGDSVDISQKSFTLTGSIIFRMAFGKRFQGSNLNNDRFEDLIGAAASVLGGFTAAECFPYVGWIIDRINGYHEKLESVFHSLDTFYQQIIDDHLNLVERSKLQEQEDIVDVMLKLEKDKIESDDASQISKDSIKAILMDIFIAGVDTSAITVVWAMAELVRNPRVMKKAQDEVRNYVGNKGSVEEVDIDQLQYLKMVIKETLRLHPPVPLLLPRETLSHFQMNGYDIGPRTLIQVNVWAIGRDPKYWKMPEEFFPERFIDNSVDFKGQHFEFLPFGAGRRGCPGIHMGLITTELALANLLYRFNWKLPNGMKKEDINMEEAAGASLTLSKKTALNLVPVKYI